MSEEGAVSREARQQSSSSHQLRFDTEKGDNVHVYERSEDDNDNDNDYFCDDRASTADYYWCGCTCNSNNDEDDFTTNDGEDSNTLPCSGCQCANCSHREGSVKRGRGRVLDGASGDRAFLNTGRSSSRRRQMGRLGTSFDAEEWLEKNKRLHRSGSFKLHNKSQEKQRKMAGEHFRTTYQMEFRDYGEIVRRAQKSQRQLQMQQQQSSRTSRQERSFSRQPQTQEHSNRGDDRRSRSSSVKTNNINNAASKTIAAGKPSSSDLQPRKEVDCICCCEAFPFPHPNHSFNMQNATNTTLPKQATPITGCYPGGVPGDVDQLDRIEYSNIQHPQTQTTQQGSYVNSGLVGAAPNETTDTSNQVPMPMPPGPNTGNNHAYHGPTLAPTFEVKDNAARVVPRYVPYQGTIPSAPAFIASGHNWQKEMPERVVQIVDTTSSPNQRQDTNVTTFNAIKHSPSNVSYSQNLRWADPVALVERNFDTSISNSQSGLSKWKQPMASFVSTANDRRGPTNGSPNTAQFYNSPPVRVENHLDERYQPPMANHDDKNATFATFISTTTNPNSLSSSLTPVQRNIPSPQAKDRIPRNQDRKSNLPSVRYRSHSSKVSNSEEITKSQRISQFLEDVSKHTMGQSSKAVVSRSATPRDHRDISRNSSGAKKINKYPTFDRQPARSLDSEHQILVVNENRKPQQNTYSHTQFPATIVINEPTDTSSAYPPKHSAYKSPKTSQTILQMRAGPSPRLSDKTQTIMAKYSPPKNSESQGTYLNNAIKRSIGGSHSNTSSLTSNIVSFEEFSQKRVGITEATQAMIKDVKAKSEKLTSRLIKELNSESKQSATETKSNTDDKISLVEKERPIKTPSSKAKNRNEKDVKNLNKTEDVLVKDAGDVKNWSKNQDDQQIIGGTGDAKSVKKSEPISKTSEKIDPQKAAKAGNPENDKTLTEDENLDGRQSWSKLFSDTLARIPQNKKSEEKDKVELESLMNRLNSMSSELNSINQQLKKDVLQIPKALKATM